jgi:hypothetical protein
MFVLYLDVSVRDKYKRVLSSWAFGTEVRANFQIFITQYHLVTRVGGNNMHTGPISQINILDRSLAASTSHLRDIIEHHPGVVSEPSCHLLSVKVSIAVTVCAKNRDRNKWQQHLVACPF